MLYTDFHIHTKYTVGNGITEIPELVDRAKELGMEYLTITDSGSIKGFQEFNRECKRVGIKPHFACGFYFAPLGLEDNTTHHLVLLAKNSEGLDNLYYLDNYSRTVGLGRKNRIDWEVLKERTSGLICLTGGLGGVFDKPWLQGDKDLAESNLDELFKLFNENLYLELQDNELVNNRVMNKVLYDISLSRGINSIITGGSFYLYREDAADCNIIREKNGNNSLKGSGYYFKSSEDLAGVIQNFPEAYRNLSKLSLEINGLSSTIELRRE